jgi:hypothetical protein
MLDLEPGGCFRNPQTWLLPIFTTQKPPAELHAIHMLHGRLTAAASEKLYDLARRNKVPTTGPLNRQEQNT